MRRVKSHRYLFDCFAALLKSTLLDRRKDPESVAQVSRSLSYVVA